VKKGENGVGSGPRELSGRSLCCHTPALNTPPGCRRRALWWPPIAWPMGLRASNCRPPPVDHGVKGEHSPDDSVRPWPEASERVATVRVAGGRGVLRTRRSPLVHACLVGALCSWVGALGHGEHTVRRSPLGQ